jgi:hypothetical protein
MLLITRDDMQEYIMARLGSPVLDLELELQKKNGLGHIQLAIQDSLDYFFREAASEAIYYDYMVLYMKQGIIEYRVPDDITDVIDVQPSWGNGFTPWTAFDVGAGESLVATTGWSQFDLVTYTGAMRYLSDVQKLVGVQYRVWFNPITHIMRVIPTPKANRAAMVAVYRKATLSEIFNNVIFRDYATARTEELWGKILSKDDYTFPGGGKINGQLILQNARTDRKDLEDKIFKEAARPYIMTDLSM